MRREAETTGQLNHPGVVAVHSFNHDGEGAPYFAMRLLDETTLEDSVTAFFADESRAGRPDRRRRMEFRELLGRFVSVCHTIAYAHSRGVLHRDIKPKNISVGEFNENIVLDWGLAKVAGTSFGSEERHDPLVLSSSGDSSETTPGKEFGSPPYMSPEQGEGALHQIGVHTDIFNLGATLYFVLCGKPPYAAPDRASVVEKAKRCDFKRPREISREVPAPLEAICLKAMEKDPARRYASVQNLARDIENWLADEPVSVLR